MKIFATLLIVGSLLFLPTFSHGGGNITYNPYGRSIHSNIVNNRVVVQEKVVQFGDNLKVIGIPVTELYPEYYYEVNKQKHCPPELSEEDAERVAKIVVEKLLERLGKTPVEGGDGDDNSVPPDQSDLERAAFSFVDVKCGSCHSGNGAKEGLSFIDDSGSKLELKDLKGKLKASEIAVLMYRATRSGHMPPGENEKLTNEQVRVLDDLALYFIEKERAE